MRRTKIIATLGPASQTDAALRALVRAGMDVARFNFSHGDHASHGDVLRRLRKIAADEGKPIAVLQDLGGPKIRTAVLEGGPIMLAPGDELVLVGGEDTGRPGRVGVSYAGLAEQCRPGDRIFCDDGRIELVVDAVKGREVATRVVRGGELGSRKGVNLPGASFAELPPLTDKDRIDLEWGLENSVDYVALSFVRRASDVRAVQEIIRKSGANVGVIAKIEKPQALDDLPAIVKAADGVMVARGDLGVELDPERVPLVQKDIINLCNAEEVPVIIATQMLESMTSASRPTRAEVSDVANAIFDGTDAVMLSGETASGEHPIAALSMMARIVEAADDHLQRNPSERHREQFPRPDTIREAIGRAAELVARGLRVKVIVAATTDGPSVLGISKSRPDAVILGLTPSEQAQRRMALYWGVIPLRTMAFTARAALIRLAETVVLSQGLARPGDFLVMVTASPLEAAGPPNNLRIHQIGAARTGDTTALPMMS